MRRRVAAASALLVLAGCAREEDPAKAGFFSGIGNLATGTYDRRLEQRQQELSEAERLKQQMAARAAESDRQREQSEAALRNRQARLARLDGDIDRLQRRLDVLKRQRTGDEARLRDAEQRLAGLRDERRQAAPDGDDAELRDIEQRLRTMDRAIAGLGHAE
jgi:chromosome segregation ATPase